MPHQFQALKHLSLKELAMYMLVPASWVCDLIPKGLSDVNVLSVMHLLSRTAVCALYNKYEVKGNLSTTETLLQDV